MGRITCPPDYPQTAPKIEMCTANGRFNTLPNYTSGICLSISHFHPESWNPVWKVNMIVVGLLSFWIGGEHTAGAVYGGRHAPTAPGLNADEVIVKLAIDSVETVKNHEKFHIFKDYAEYIGINERPHEK